ncbi:unnamed protein product [Ceutorhynchus assimilis]|uniref:DUF8207 domain-containing protein n=1 Tax=Ceutorhynchus assimilis TaxID=467358 RepID=A0A9N9MXH9_9CUCU|nr:unnamed protein product [Ceutorhynchus assimilis]
MIPFTEIQTSLNRLTLPVNLRVYLEDNEIEIRNASPSPPLPMAALDFNYFEWQLPFNPRLSPTPLSVDYEGEGNEEYVNEEPQPLDLRIINVDDDNDDDEEEQVINVDSDDDDDDDKEMEVIIIDDTDENEINVINVVNNDEKPLDLRSIRKKYLALKLERKEEDEALDRIINPITEPLREFVEKTVGRKVQVKHEKVKLEAPKTYFESEPKLPRNVEFQPAEIIAQTSENLESDDDDDDDDGAEDVFYEPLQHLKEDLQKSIHDRSGAYEEFLDQYPKVAQEYVDRYYKQSDEIDHSYGLKHDMKTDDWSMGSKKVNFLPNRDIKVGAVSYKGTQGLYDLLFLKKPIYQTEDDKLQFTDILNRTNVHRRDFDPSKQVKGSTSSKYRQFVKPLVSSSSEAKRLKSMMTSASWRAESGGGGGGDGFYGEGLPWLLLGLLAGAGWSVGSGGRNPNSSARFAIYEPGAAWLSRWGRLPD